MIGRLRSIGYGVGNLGAALFFNTIQTYLLFFYIDTVRLDSRLVGLAFALSYGVWNAINDPLIGAFSDRVKTRWGRRVPFIALGTPVTLALFILVWSPPLGGQPLANPVNWGMLIWFAVIIALFDLANTAVSVPYISLFPELFQSLRQRTEVSIYRQIAAVVGTALGLAVMPLLVSGIGSKMGTLGGWSGASIVLGIVAAASLMVSLHWQQRASPGGARAVHAAPAGIQGDTGQSILSHLYGRRSHDQLHLELAFCHGPVLLQVCARRLHGGDEPPLCRMFVTALLLYPLWRSIALRLGSRATLALSVSLFVVFLLPVLFVKTMTQAIIMMLLVGSGHSGITLVREILLGDVIDEDELATGRRREGSYFGVCAFIERLVLVLIGGATGLVLALSRYDAAAASQAPSVALGIRLGMAVLPLAALAILQVALRFYPLGKRQVQELKEELAAAHPGREAS
jgi:GPH family glycoside/pentoside/hexuronide:cation symporter